MAGLCRRTFKILDPWAHVLQSVEVIFTTRIGSRVMMRHFHGGVAELLGRLMTPPLLAAFRLVVAIAIDLWEPRLKVRQVDFTGSPEEIRLGHAGLLIHVDYRPRGHLGDETVEGRRTVRVGLVNSQITVT